MGDYSCRKVVFEKLGVLGYIILLKYIYFFIFKLNTVLYNIV